MFFPYKEDYLHRIRQQAPCKFFLFLQVERFLTNEKDDKKCCYISKITCNYNGCYSEILTYITIEEFIKVLSNYSYEGGKFVRNNTFKY